MSAEIKSCRSCGAEIYWLKNVNTGKVAPIDAHPNPKGNCLLNLEQAVYRIAFEFERQHPNAPVYTNHFMTCPAAKQWARHGGSGMRGKAK